jgi:hypothetical protein
MHAQHQRTAARVRSDRGKISTAARPPHRGEQQKEP